MKLHVPIVGDWLQRWQVPLHAVLQQTPSTQFPDWQSAVARQTLPFAQALQPAPPPQSVSVSVPFLRPSEQD